ncbi:MAG: glycosyltransferase [Bacteroidaceae bacterium]|nr:glycosyltransferase [Bacteroidaceae bacterium]
MNTPKVSIVVPCYKVEEYIDRCVGCLVNQTLKDIEIILVDDKSPDAVPWLCDKWAEKDKRVKVIHKEENEGLGMARNTGLEAASGDYIMFIDSDDTYNLDACEKMYFNAVRYNADVVACNFLTEIQPGMWQKHANAVDTVLNRDEIYEYVLDLVASPPYVSRERLHPVSVWALCLRSTIIKGNNIRFYSEREIVSEDILFKITFLRYCNIMVDLNEPLYHYYHTAGSLTHSFRSSAFENLKVLRNKMIDIMGDDKQVLQRINRFTISEIRMHITRLVNSDETLKIQKIKRILEDRIWNEVVSFKPSFYGLYAHFFYNLCLWKCSRILYLYTFLASIIRDFVNKWCYICCYIHQKG